MKTFFRMTAALAIFLSACGKATESLSPEEMQSTAETIAETMIVETAAAIPTATFTSSPLPPTATPEPTATATATTVPTETNTPEPTATPTTAYTGIDPDLILLYYLIPENGGPVACGDTPIGIHFGVYKSGDAVTDVRAAMQALLANHSETVLGLYNPLAPSSLRVGSVAYNGKTVELNIEGELVRGKHGCEWSRILYQIGTTARKAAYGYVVVITYNNHPIKDFLTLG